ncbi:MAG: DUF4340 domain-containing protein [Verrucomicrobia bacterium]|nr:MAG: DUF4340 domain-containing protein [Verrucomicrobiota bacterium]
MNPRTTVILLLVALGLGAWIVGVERKGETTKQREEAARKALKIEQGQVTGFTFVAGTNPVVTCAKQNDKWRITAPVAARADAAAVDRLLSGLAEMKRGEIISAQDRTQRNAQLADYGLEPARCALALELGGRKQTVLFGRTAPVGDALYVKDNAHADIVATDAAVTNSFPTNAVALRDRALFSGSAFDVKRLDLRGGGRLVQLAKNDKGDWQIQQPLLARADRPAVQGVLDALFDWKVDQFARDGVADFTAYGLDENATKITVNAGDKISEQVLLIGKPAGINAALVYAATPPEKSVYAVSTVTLAKVSIKLNELRDRRLLTFSSYDVAGLKLQQGEKTLELKKAANGNWSIVQPRPSKADSQRVQDFLTQITGVKIEDFLDQATANPVALGLAEPAWRVTLLKAGTESVGGGMQKAVAPGEKEQTILVSGLTRTGGHVAVRLEHEATPYEIPGAAITNLTVDPLAFRGREILNLYSGDVLKLALAHEGVTQVVERATVTNDFAVVAPVKGIADKEQIHAVLNAFCNLQAQRLVAEDAKDLVPFGLAQPEFSLTLGVKGDASLSKTVVIGAVVAGGHYAMVRGQDLVFVLDAEAAMLLTKGWLKPVPMPAATNEAVRATTTTNAAGTGAGR